MQEIMQFFGKHTILSLLWCGLLVAVVVTTFHSLFGKIKEVNRAMATRLINKEEAVILDIRTREDFRKGHIVNSINLIPSEIKDGYWGELGKKKSLPVVVVCTTGTSARQVAANLLKSGFTRVYVLKEGITGWQSENLPLVKGKK